MTTPFLALRAMEDTAIDKTGMDDIMQQASSADKILKEYAALHAKRNLYDVRLNDRLAVDRRRRTSLCKLLLLPVHTINATAKLKIKSCL
jgi:hypothetical protein